MAEYMIQGETLTAVADAIRNRAGTTGPMQFPDGFVGAVAELVNRADYLTDVMNLNVTELVSNSATRVSPLLQAESTILEKVEMPAAVTVGEKAFYRCVNLATVQLQSAKTIGPQTFGDCTSLEEIYLPSLESIEGWGFNFAYCSNLVKAHFPKLKYLTSNDFAGCSKLTALILGADSICALADTGVFAGSPIANGAGYIYVPKALVDSYKAATNWSTYANQFRALEDYTVDGTTTGELNESKI